MLRLTTLACLLIMVFLQGTIHAQQSPYICKYQLSQMNNLLLKKQAANKTLTAQFNYDVKYYRTHWYINPAVDSIRGSVMTVFKVIDSYFSEISFDMDTALHVDSIKYHGVQLYNYSFPDYGPILIKFPLVPLRNSIDSIEIFYHGQPNKQHRGFVQDFHQGAPIVWTLSEPYYANDWWPCKQDLDDKADSVDISVTVPKYCKAGSNGKLLEVIPTDTFLTYHWHHSYPITPYLVGITVSNYNEFSTWYKFDNNDSMPVLNYVFPEDEAQWKQDYWSINPALGIYSNLFGRYPFWKEKYGNAEFTFSGGQEHQTMSFIRNFGFSLVVHEMAHQWFGDKVTCNSWQDIWLNEGFATYCEVITNQIVLGNDIYMAVKRSKRQGAFQFPDQSVSVLDTTSVDRIFSSATTYNKASMVLHMLRFMLGDTVFFKTLYDYVNDSSLAFSFAQTSDLRKHFEKNTGRSFVKFFDDWIYKTGYPTYTITRQQDAAMDLILNFNEIPYDPSVSHYEIPLMPVRIWAGGKSTDMLLNVDSAQKKFIIPVGHIVDSIKIDMNEDILFKYQIQDLDSSFGNQVFLAPNPASDYITLEIKDPSLQTQGDFIITDALGRIILNGNYKNTSVRVFSLTNFTPGVYILYLHSGNTKLSRKFVKTQ